MCLCSDPVLFYRLPRVSLTLKMFGLLSENIYDQIPSDSYYDAPYEMRSNDDVYEPEPSGNVITINGIAMIR